MPTTFIPAEIIENKIFLIRGRKVMLDRDLAALNTRRIQGFKIPFWKLKTRVSF
jgi:hypothetical protein